MLVVPVAGAGLVVVAAVVFVAAGLVAGRRAVVEPDAVTQGALVVFVVPAVLVTGAGAAGVACAVVGVAGAVIVTVRTPGVPGVVATAGFAVAVAPPDVCSA